MPINLQLLQSIDQALRNLPLSLNSASAASDLFEGYIFSLIIEAARHEGASVEFRNVNGQRINYFVFRTSPGYIYSTRHAYSHALITFPNLPLLEVHIGVRVHGKSTVLHECDVAVIEHDECETCRQNQVSPKSSKVLLSVECKFYSTTLHLNLARSFIGLEADLSTKDAFFVSNNSSSSVEKFLTRRSKKWEHRVIPSSLNESTKLRYAFQTVFKEFKAKNG